MSPHSNEPVSGTPAPAAHPPGRFEAAYAELRQVIAQLEEGGLDLEDAVRLFERGTGLVTRCQEIIDDAELRVTRLAAESASPLTDAQLEG
jgi:exodeoxyribonuclease VII small subunit